ncbi:MAG: hypothetical protein OXC07_12295 [Kistimonas sp.]|nr:hypothetical protein [Kistimonas sp.]
MRCILTRLAGLRSCQVSVRLLCRLVIGSFRQRWRYQHAVGELWSGVVV